MNDRTLEIEALKHLIDPGLSSYSEKGGARNQLLTTEELSGSIYLMVHQLQKTDHLLGRWKQR